MCIKKRLSHLVVFLISILVFLFGFGRCNFVFATSNFQDLVKQNSAQENNQQQIDTKNLQLRATKNEDNESLARILSAYDDKEMGMFNGTFKQMSQEEALDYLKKYPGSAVNFTIFHENSIIGQLKLEYVGLKDKYFVKFVLFIDKNYQNKKYAYEAVLPVLKLVLKAPDVVVVNASCYKANFSVAKLMEKVLAQKDDKELEGLCQQFTDKSVEIVLPDNRGEFCVKLFARKINESDSVFGKVLEVIKNDEKMKQALVEYFVESGGQLNLFSFVQLFQQDAFKNFPADLVKELLEDVGLGNFVSLFS